MIYQVLYEVNRVLLVYAMSMILPLFVAIFEGNLTSVWAFSVTILLSSLLSLFLMVKPRQEIQHPSLSFLMLVLIWFGVVVISFIPWYLYFDATFLQCLFETVSALTTSGIEVIGGVESWPVSFLLYRQQLCWFGGVGVVVMSLSLLSVYHQSIYAHFLTDYGLELKGLGFSQRVAQTAIQVAKIYLLLTLVSAIAYFICGVGLGYAVLESMAMISTSGYSIVELVPGLYSQSVHFLIASMSMLLGSIGFQFYGRLLKFNYQAPKEVLSFFRYLLGGGVLLILLNPTVRVGEVLYMLVSFVSTTGTGDISLLSHHSVWLLVVLSMIGGCAGSTAGGIKLDRVKSIMSSIFGLIENAWRPDRLLKYKIPSQYAQQQNAQSYVLLFLMTLLIGFACLVLAGMVPEIAILSSVSTMTNVGGLLDAGVYQSLTPLQSFILTVLMWVGRVELVAILVLCLPNYWRQI
jgi:trk system potassium uptake protein TrkH